MNDSGDEPRNRGNDDATAPDDGASTPWERPERWEREATPSDAGQSAPGDTVVPAADDDAVDASTDAAAGRRARRRSDDDGDDVPPGSVSASDLIARFTGQQPAIVDDGTPSATDDGGDATPEPAGVGGEEGERAGGHRTGGGWLVTGRVLVSALAVILLLVAGTEWVIKARADAALQAGSISALNPNDTNIITPTLTGDASDGDQDGSGSLDADGDGVPDKAYQAENILVIGTDARHSAADIALGGANQGPGGADVVMVVHLAADRSHVTVVSIPRDTYIDAPTCKAWDHETRTQKDEIYPTQYSLWRINSTFSVGGPPCTVKGVQQFTGLRIDRVIVMDFAGFTKIVDALGGITVNACRPIIDRNLGTVLPSAGKQHIDGVQALNLVRARKVVGDTTSDLARIKRQQKVLSTMLRSMTSAGVLLNPIKLDNVLQAFVNNVRTDNVTMDDLLDIAHSLGNLDPSQVTFFTLPTYLDSNGVGLHPTEDSDLLWRALRRDEPLPGEVTEPPSATPTTAPDTSAPTVSTSTTVSTPPPVTTTVTEEVTTTPTTPQTLSVSPADVSLQVVNVAGRALVANRGADVLRAAGFTIASNDLLRLASQDQQSMTIEYAPGLFDEALTLAAAVPGAAMVVNDSLGGRVRIMLGTSFNQDDFAALVRDVTAGDPVPAELSTGVDPVTSTITRTVTSTPEPVTSRIRITPTPQAPTTSSAPSTTGLVSSEMTSVNAGSAGCI